MQQHTLFDTHQDECLISGLSYQAAFLSVQEERELLLILGTLDLEAVQYKEFLSRRRVVSFGGRYDYQMQQLLPTAALDERLEPLRVRIAKWMGIPCDELVQTLVAEYTAGTALGWHRDVPQFQRIVGVSLGSTANLRFRPYPYRPEMKSHVVRLEVAPRSIYRIEGDARWAWHTVLSQRRHCDDPLPFAPRPSSEEITSNISRHYEDRNS